MTHILPATESDAAAIASNIRPMDAFELKMFLGKSPIEGMEFILGRANKAWTVIHKGTPAVMFGYNVTSAIERVASPFMIATEYAASHPFLFARYSKVVAQYFEGFFLLNYVLDKNVDAKKWLQWMGFHLNDPIIAATGEPVRMFTKDCR